MILYADDYQSLNYQSPNSVLELNWTAASSQLSSHHYTNKMQNVVYYLDQSKPEKILANLSHLTFTDHLRVERPIFKLLHRIASNQKIKKIALVRSKDVITQFIIDSILPHINTIDFKALVFDDEEQASLWLNSDQTEAN